MRLGLLLIIFVGSFFCVFGQETFVIKGIIFKKESSNRVEFATIQNLKSSNSVKSDEWGTFSIDAKLGDSVKIIKNNFQEYTVVITKKQNLIIYLTPAYQLNEVKVTAQTTKQQQQEILDGYRAKGVYNNGKIPFLMYIFNPLTALQNLIGADANNARTFYKYIQRENKDAFVDNKFNKELIQKNIPIKEDEIVEYMYKYRPKYEDVLYWNQYDAINYIKKSYQKYKSIK